MVTITSSYQEKEEKEEEVLRFILEIKPFYHHCSFCRYNKQHPLIRNSTTALTVVTFKRSPFFEGSRLNNSSLQNNVVVLFKRLP